jgi:hypothetical protein
MLCRRSAQFATTQIYSQAERGPVALFGPYLVQRTTEHNVNLIG